jgi:hypothetical protein
MGETNNNKKGLSVDGDFPTFAFSDFAKFSSQIKTEASLAKRLSNVEPDLSTFPISPKRVTRNPASGLLLEADQVNPNCSKPVTPPTPPPCHNCSKCNNSNNSYNLLQIANKNATQSSHPIQVYNHKLCIAWESRASNERRYGIL